MVKVALWCRRNSAIDGKIPPKKKEISPLKMRLLLLDDMSQLTVSIARNWLSRISSDSIPVEERITQLQQLVKSCQQRRDAIRDAPSHMAGDVSGEDLAWNAYANMDRREWGEVISQINRIIDELVNPPASQSTS
jgi:hypothetical protein